MTTQNRTIALHTLGCKLNQTETATIGRQFVRAGYAVVPFGDRADVVVLNTCSVTEKADKECRQLLRRARRSSPDAFIAVVGCYAQLRSEEIAELPEVDLVAGTKEKFSIIDHVGEKSANVRPMVLRDDPEELKIAIPSHSQGIDRTRAFLKVQDGCDYTCSFCTIPRARGESRSVPDDTVLSEASELVAAGFKEIVLTGVNTGDYGRKEDSSLLQLLERLVRVDGIERIRISSVEPNLLSDDLLDFWIGHEKICNHWHIPLQSGSREVLRLMQRRYTPDWYAERLEKIQSAHPSAAIGADVIVGTPGETDDYFDESVRFIKSLPLTYLHVFSYSQRPWTSAAVAEDQIDPARKAFRSSVLRELSDRNRRAFHERFIGRTVRVLIEGRGSDGLMTGLSEEYIRVCVEDGDLKENDLIDVHITGADTEVCTGTICESSPRTEVSHVMA